MTTPGDQHHAPPEGARPSNQDSAASNQGPVPYELEPPQVPIPRTTATPRDTSPGHDDSLPPSDSALDAEPPEPHGEPADTGHPVRRPKPTRCPECGHDLANTSSRTCPACGALARPAAPQNRIALEYRLEDRRERRARRRRTATYFLVGTAVTILIRLATGRTDLMLADARWLAIGGSAAIGVYALCRVIFLGVERDFITEAIRLASVLVMTLATIALVGSLPLGCLAYSLTPASGLAVYLLLLRRELDLDVSETGIVGLISAAVMAMSVLASYFMF